MSFHCFNSQASRRSHSRALQRALLRVCRHVDSAAGSESLWRQQVPSLEARAGSKSKFTCLRLFCGRVSIVHHARKIVSAAVGGEASVEWRWAKKTIMSILEARSSRTTCRSKIPCMMSGTADASALVAWSAICPPMLVHSRTYQIRKETLCCGISLCKPNTCNDTILAHISILPTIHVKALLLPTHATVQPICCRSRLVLLVSPTYTHPSSQPAFAMSWKETTRQKREQLLSSFPLEWIISLDEIGGRVKHRNVVGLITKHVPATVREITELPVVVLLEKLHQGNITACEALVCMAP